MTVRLPRPWTWLPALALVLLALVGCGADGSNTGSPVHGDGGVPMGEGGVVTPGSDGSVSPWTGDAGALTDGHSPFDPDAFWANDPPPQWCGPDGGWTPPPPPGGTPDCPDDKNRQGCPCTALGQQAACWPGLRENRNLGQCKDGVTTCIQNDEFGPLWGPCVGYVLPDPTATKGKAACKCFSAGQWKVDNLSPCFVTYSGGAGAGTYGVSTFMDGAGQAKCPTNLGTAPPPAPEPGKPWSTNTLQVDCAGHFKLCFTIKAGNFSAPAATDCVLATVCTEAEYPTANQITPFPDLPSWTSGDTACAAQFVATGGYGEMTVVGKSVRCDAVDDGAGNAYVFNRVQYCKQECMTNPSAPGCEGCMQGGSGNF